MAQPTRRNPVFWSFEERWDILMDNIKDYAIFMLDPQGVVATWNKGAERILGYTEEEALGLKFSAIFTPDDLAADLPEGELRDAREKGRAEDERWHLRKDGTRFWAAGVVTPLWDDSGNLRGYAKILRDITDRKRAEEQTVEESRRKDEFLAMLSHELRNPMAGISNAAQLLKRQCTPEQETAVEIIERQVLSLCSLVDDLLDVSRMNSGKVRLRTERVEFQQMIHQAVQACMPLIEERKHELTMELPAEAIWLDADPQRLEQTVCNLLTNAAKYTDPGGSITLTVERLGNDATLSVKDTGSGIPSDMLGRIFDLFIQADRSLDRSQGGLGVGLALVQRLVQMHGGTVEARSEGLGKGSEFIVRLPVLPDMEAEQVETRSEAGAAADGAGIRVLIAEDNPDTAESMAMLLRAANYEVQVARNGSEALQLTESWQPAAILLDIGLPAMDGYQVAERIREQERYRDILLVAATGYGQPQDRERSRNAGFDIHLVKPVGFETLHQVLQQVAGRQSSEH